MSPMSMRHFFDQLTPEQVQMLADISEAVLTELRTGH